ncbi:MAG TPA: PfkB family carbohydrate kinase, partial [Kofleriaceae bacterium]|nr:PfkB family carbohydrate kinase [Kofleriaceae bacterium]
MARLRGHRVLVIGDLMVDEYLRGDVHRISPEAPVPVLEVRDTERRLGGAANTAANIQRLGGAATVLGVVGDDPTAVALRTGLEHAGVAVRACVVPGRPTTRKTRLVAQGQQIVRVDEEVRTPVAGAATAELVAAIDELAAGAAAVVVSDYAKGVITAEIAQAAIAAGRRHRVPVVVDPKQRDFAVYRGATVITPNLGELERAASAGTATAAEIAHAAARVAPVVDGAALLVTRGADGMTLYREGVAVHHVGATAREVFDVTGAGDTVVATLALALAAGESME